jgi:hypothetical protein
MKRRNFLKLIPAVAVAPVALAAGSEPQSSAFEARAIDVLNNVQRELHQPVIYTHGYIYNESGDILAVGDLVYLDEETGWRHAESGKDYSDVQLQVWVG